MTVHYWPYQNSPDELLLSGDSAADDQLLDRLRTALAGAGEADVAVRLTTLLDLWDRHEATPEASHAVDDS